MIDASLPDDCSSTTVATMLTMTRALAKNVAAINPVDNLVATRRHCPHTGVAAMVSPNDAPLWSLRTAPRRTCHANATASGMPLGGIDER